MATKKKEDTGPTEIVGSTRTYPSTASTEGGEMASAGTNRSSDSQEIEALSRTLSVAYKRRVEYLHKKEGMSLEAATRRAQRPLGMSLSEFPDESVTWTHLARALGNEEDGPYEYWRYLKDISTDEFESGHLAALSMSHKDTPLCRARFLAVRDALIAEWKPRGPSELILIEAMAHAYFSKLYWAEELHRRSYVEFREKRDQWNTPRVSEAKAIEMAASMMDRFDKIYHRNLRSLRDLRRYAPSMVIQGTQVNIAQHQIIRQDGATASPGETESLSPTPTEAKDYLGPEMDDAQLGRAVSNR